MIPPGLKMLYPPVLIGRNIIQIEKIRKVLEHFNFLPQGDLPASCSIVLGLCFNSFRFELINRVDSKATGPEALSERDSHSLLIIWTFLLPVLSCSSPSGWADATNCVAWRVSVIRSHSKSPTTDRRNAHNAVTPCD